MGYGLSESFVSYVKRKEKRKKKNLLYILELCFISEKKLKNELKQYLSLALGK